MQERSCFRGSGSNDQWVASHWAHTGTVSAKQVVFCRAPALQQQCARKALHPESVTCVGTASASLTRGRLPLQVAGLMAASGRADRNSLTWGEAALSVRSSAVMFTSEPAAIDNHVA